MASNTFYAECMNMIPAERCEVIIYPSMQSRREADWPDVLVVDLETTGVDEIVCPYAGLLDMTEGHDAHGVFMEADCPICGQRIVLYDDPPPPLTLLAPMPTYQPKRIQNIVVTATQLTDEDHRYLVYSIVDDEWETVAVACDLPKRKGSKRGKRGKR